MRGGQDTFVGQPDPSVYCALHALIELQMRSARVTCLQLSMYIDINDCIHVSIKMFQQVRRVDREGSM